MSELEDALERAEAELAETKIAVTSARGQRVESLAQQLALLQTETVELEARARSLEEELGSLREKEEARLAELAAP